MKEKSLKFKKESCPNQMECCLVGFTEFVFNLDIGSYMHFYYQNYEWLDIDDLEEHLSDIPPELKNIIYKFLAPEKVEIDSLWDRNNLTRQTVFENMITKSKWTVVSTSRERILNVKNGLFYRIVMNPKKLDLNTFGPCLSSLGLDITITWEGECISSYRPFNIYPVVKNDSVRFYIKDLRNNGEYDSDDEKTTYKSVSKCILPFDSLKKICEANNFELSIEGNTKQYTSADYDGYIRINGESFQKILPHLHIAKYNVNKATALLTHEAPKVSNITVDFGNCEIITA